MVVIIHKFHLNSVVRSPTPTPKGSDPITPTLKEATGPQRSPKLPKDHPALKGPLRPSKNLPGLPSFVGECCLKLMFWGVWVAIFDFSELDFLVFHRYVLSEIYDLGWVVCYF